MKTRLNTLTLLTLLLFINIQASATSKQDSIPTIQYRITADYGQSFQYGQQSVTSPYHILRGGMHIDIPIKHRFSIETGLKYNYVFGKKTQRYPHSGVAKYNYTGHLIDIPVRIHYTLPIFWGLKLFAYAGPNLNIGLAQQQTINFTQQQVTPTLALPYPTSGTYDAYANTHNRFNIQIGAGGGIQWKKFRIRSGYDWGINNLHKGTDITERMKGWHIGIEYEF